MNARGVIAALERGEIDVGPLDSYAFDLMKAADDDDAGRVRIVATTRLAPMPALVCSQAVPTADVDRLRDALLAVGDASELNSQRARLRLHGFAPVDPEAYETQETRARLVEQSPVVW
jgi:ABC-type phosphate/phosphonate transport system substrate-binding protein